LECPQCQLQNPLGANFCGQCGTPLELVCPVCLAVSPVGNRFCHRCGASLRGEPRSIASHPPGSYTPKHLVERVLTSRSALEGERKQVTVLFCDLANSTALAVRLGPETMHSLLGRFFEYALEEVHRYEGTINQFLGDGFMALFGAPLAHEDHARRAVLAALCVQRRLTERQAASDIVSGVQLAVRMGLHSGLVVVGKIGDDLRMDYTAVGDTTNLAYRLQQLAEPGTIVVSEATSRLAGGDVQVESLGPVLLKGRSESVEAHRVTGLGPRRSPLEIQAERSLTPFVGREREFSALLDRLQQMQHGKGQTVGILGEPGVGKSRLLFEFRRGPALRGLAYLEGRCLSYGASIPFLPVIDIVRNRCGIVESDPPGTILEKLRTVLEVVGMDPGEGLPYLLQLLGIREGAERLKTLSAEMIKSRTFETLRHMFLGISQLQPLILAVEDLHWIDKISEEYLESLVENLAGARILLLATYRPGYRPSWLEKACASQLNLGALPSDASLRVVRSNSQEALPDTTARVILEKAEGNPFFLEELTRAVVEQGGLNPALTVPDTVQGVLMARIDRLPSPVKRVLQTAAVLGRQFPVRVLRAVWTEGEALEALLEGLIRLEFLFRQGAADDPVYAFKHALTQDVAYDSLLIAHRESLHAAAGLALEVMYADRLAEYYELLAYHYGRSRNFDKAVEYLSLANRKAARRSAMVEARAYFDDAIRLLDALPETEVNLQRRLALVVNQEIVMLMLFKFGEYHDLLERHRAAALKVRDPRIVAAFNTCLGWCEYALGHYREAIQAGKEAVGLFTSSGYPDDAGAALCVQQWSRLWKGDYDEVLALRDKVLDILERRPRLRWYMLTLSTAAWAHSFMGRWERALGEGERLLRVGKELRDDSVVAFAALTIAMAHGFKGDSTRAVEFGALGVQKAPTPADLSWAQGMLGMAWCRAGEPDKAIEILREAVSRGVAADFRPNQLFTLFLGEAHWLVGAHEEARRVLQGALAYGQTSGVPFVIGSAHRLLGEIALTTNPDQGGKPLAGPHFDESITALASIKAENELALAYAGRGRLLARAGKPHAARQALTGALEIVERLGTVHGSAQIRQALASLPNDRVSE